MSELIATGISQEILKVLQNQGLPIKTSLHMDIPPFPEDITAISDQQLMTLAAKYMENYNFVSTQVACSAIAELEAENSYESLHARGLISKTNGKTTEKSIMLKAIVQTDPEVTALENAKTYAYAYRKMLETMQQSLERYYYLVSREITRRTHGDKMRTNRFIP